MARVHPLPALLPALLLVPFAIACGDAASGGDDLLAGVVVDVDLAPVYWGCGDAPVVAGDSLVRVVTLINRGSETLHVQAAAITGDANCSLSPPEIDAGTAARGIAPGGEGFVQFRYAPQQAGVDWAALEVTTNAERASDAAMPLFTPCADGASPCLSTLSVPLCGWVIAPDDEPTPCSFTQCGLPRQAMPGEHAAPDAPACGQGKL